MKEKILLIELNEFSIDLLNKGVKDLGLRNIKKILNDQDIKSINGLKLNSRPSEIKPETYYRITELFEKK